MFGDFQARIFPYSTEYRDLSSPIMGKYGVEKLRIRAPFTQLLARKLCSLFYYLYGTTPLC